MTQGPARIKGRGPDGQAVVDLGPLENMLDYKFALRTCARGIAGGKDPHGNLIRASMVIGRLAWIDFTTKGLELKGLNMDGSAPEVKVTLNDYATSHEQLMEENAALKAQVEMLMQGRERPRPPRPQMN